MLRTLVLALALAVADDKPVTPEEATKMVGKKATVELTVESVGTSTGGDIVFLNSRRDFKAADNFTVMVSKKGVGEFKKEKVDDVGAHFKGKTIRVSGIVKLYRDRPEIIVNEPGQVTLVEKK